MNVLITGGCGFVGTNLVARIAADLGWKLRIFDNESLGRREDLGAFAGEFLHGDLRDAAAVFDALSGIDTVVHLAADTRVIDSIENPRFNFDVNVIGSLNLLEAMRQRGVGRLICASTGGAIIGHASGPVNESMLPAPLAPYGASKLAVEGYCNAYSASYGLRAVSLRFANVYGPRSFHKGSVVAAFFKAILAGQPLTVYGDGTQVRDYVYVKDICDGILAAIQNDSVSGAVQLGSGRPTSLNELIDVIRRVTMKDVKIDYKPARTGEIHSTYCDIARARTVLGFNPSSIFENAMGETWEWYVKNQ